MEQLHLLFASVQQKVSNIFRYIGFFGILVIGFLLISSMFRFLFGKRAQLGKAITSAIEILCLYLISIALFCFGLHGEFFISPLPFLSFEDGCLQISPIFQMPFPAICTQFLKLLMIAFLVNVMNSVIPEGKKPHIWLLLRASTVILAIGINYVLDLLLLSWLPNGFGNSAPLILIGVLFLLIALGSMKLVVGATLFVANPIIGALYTFFFSNFIGRALARSIISAGLVAGLVFLLNSLEIYTIAVSATALIALIPVYLLIVGLWYAIDRIL